MSGAPICKVTLPMLVKKIGLTSKRYVCLVGLFLQETLLILITYHLKNGMKNKA